MIIRTRLLAPIAMASILFTGCAATHPATTTAHDASMSAGMSMPPGMRMPGMAMPATDPPSAAAAGPGPSQAARMVCAPGIRHAIATMLGLASPPPVTTSWAARLYTCTYRLPAGQLVLSVNDAPDAASGRSYFDALRQRLGPTQPLTGLLGLGQPGYTTHQGTDVILKDGKTLRVDATALPTRIGPQHQTRDDLAYEITTDILGCWTGK